MLRAARVRAWWPDIAAVSVFASAMAAMHLVHFGSPPLDVDELSFFMLNLSLISEPGSEWYRYSQDTGQRVGPFPVLYFPYIGGLGAYASAPFHYILGPGIEAVRLYNLFATMAIQASLYATARYVFSRRAALASAGLFTVLPTAVFFSRQGILYDWIVLAVALLVLYFGVRFVRGGSLWNMGAAILLSFVAMWAYLSSAWFVLGTVAALPVCYASMRARRLRITKRAALAGAVFALAGAAPFVAHHAASPDYSHVSILLQTAGGESRFLRPDTDNSDYLAHLGLRADNLYAMLAEPFTGLEFARIHVHGGPDGPRPLGAGPADATFLVLLGAGVAAAAAEIAQRRRYRRRMAGLLVLLAVMVLTSAFTVTVFNEMQLGIILPFVFLLMGAGIDALLQRISGLKSRLARAPQRHLLLAVVGAVAALQYPAIGAGLDLIGEDPAGGHLQASADLGRHIDDNGLEPVVLDWYTHRTLFFALEGKHVPLDPRAEARRHGAEPGGRPLTAEDGRLVRDDVLFVMYSYPELLDCAGGVPPGADMVRSQCAQSYFVESAAERNGLGVVVKDFELPSGHPYYRTFQFRGAGQ